jgi:hypothetical protein
MRWKGLKSGRERKNIAIAVKYHVNACVSIENPLFQKRIG